MRVRYKALAQEINNDFYAMNSTASTWTSDQINSLGTLMLSWWVDHVRSLVCSDIQLDSVRITDLTSDTGTIERDYRPDDAEKEGTHEGVSMPNNVTCALKLGIGLRRRGVNGRIFIPPPPVAEVTDGELNNLYAPNWVSAVQFLKDHIPDINPDFGLVVLSRVQGGVKRAEGLGFGVQSVNFADLSLDSQKDRLPLHKKRKRHA